MKTVLCLMLVAAATMALAADVNPYNDYKGWAGTSRYSASSGQMYQRHAYDNSRVLNDSASAAKPVPKEIVQEQATEIRHNVEASQKAYSRLSGEAKKDPAAAKSLATIDSSLGKVLAMCDMLDRESAKPEGDSVAISKCCTDMGKELKAADADHEQLMKQMKLDDPKMTSKM